MVICVEEMKESTKNLELVNYYSKVTEYKVNIQKSITFPYICNEQVEFEIEDILASPKMKCLYS